jgi:hypothetical protein
MDEQQMNEHEPDRNSTSEAIRPLTEEELEAVAGGMTAVFIAGNMSVAIWATPTAHGVITTTCGCG